LLNLTGGFIIVWYEKTLQFFVLHFSSGFKVTHPIVFSYM